MTDGLPAIKVDGPSAKHLEILCFAGNLYLRVIEGGGKAANGHEMLQSLMTEDDSPRSATKLE